MTESRKDACRAFLKDDVRLTIDFRKTDQNLGVPPPPLQKPFPDDAVRVDLARPDAWTGIRSVDLTAAIENRRSQRVFRRQALALEELAYLLWVTQGIRRVVHPGTALRNVPSAGARHALETYLGVLNVDGLAPGIYRYLPVEHQLLLVDPQEGLAGRLVDASYGQSFVGKAAVSFIWTTVPYRMEWRYDMAAHKVIALDAGHVCQNLYLAVSAVDCGTCAIAAYHQELMDALLGVDGKDEFTVYMAPVGKL